MSTNLTHRPSHRDGNLGHRPSHRDGNLSHRPSHAGVEYIRRSAEDWDESSFPSYLYFWFPTSKVLGVERCGEKKEEKQTGDNNIQK